MPEYEIYGHECNSSPVYESSQLIWKFKTSFLALFLLSRLPFSKKLSARSFKSIKPETNAYAGADIMSYKDMTEDLVKRDAIA